MSNLIVPSVPAIENRKAALFDMAYLVVAFTLYVVAFFLPIVGGAAGVFLLGGGSHDGTRHVGKVTVVCAALGIVSYVAVYALVSFIMGAVAVS